MSRSWNSTKPPGLTCLGEECQPLFILTGPENALITLLHQLWPVHDRPSHVSAMDVIERPRISPPIFNIIDLETDIGWGECWHAGIDVDADNFRRWVRVAHPDAPDACPGSNVKDSLRRRPNRGSMELAIVHDQKHLVQHVQPVELLLGLVNATN